MKRTLLLLFALLLALLACSAPEDPPTNGNPPTELSPLVLPTAQLVAETTSILEELPTEPNAEALESAVNDRIQALLSTLRIQVSESTTSAHEVLVCYLGVLQDDLTPKEELEGILQTTVRGEARIPVSIDPDALTGVKVGDTDIPLNVLDPTIFSLDAYQKHTVLFHVEILAVYRAPKDLSEVADIESTLGYSTPEALVTALRAEERARLLWQEALSHVQVREIPEAIQTRIASEMIESHQNRFLTSGTNLSFSGWLSLHTEYRDEASLRAASASFATSAARSLIAACALLDAYDVRESLPDYITGCTPLANESGCSSVRFFTWEIGGSAIGWQRIISAHCIEKIALKSA